MSLASVSDGCPLSWPWGCVLWCAFALGMYQSQCAADLWWELSWLASMPRCPAQLCRHGDRLTPSLCLSSALLTVWRWRWPSFQGGFGEVCVWGSFQLPTVRYQVCLWNVKCFMSLARKKKKSKYRFFTRSWRGAAKPWAAGECLLTVESNKWKFLILPLNEGSSFSHPEQYPLLPDLFSSLPAHLPCNYHSTHPPTHSYLLLPIHLVTHPPRLLPSH